MNITARHPVTRNDPTSTEFEMADGRFFDPFSPDPRLVSLPVIATALANSCRFGGHVTDFYSTAQHSVLVALLAPRDLAAQRSALLHDADEAFGLPDLLTPVKRVFGSFVAAQDDIGKIVEERFRFTAEDHKRIKPADRIALILEKRRLKDPRNEARWMEWAGDLQIPDDIQIEPLSPVAARALYIQALRQVFENRRPISRNWLSRRDGFDLRPSPELQPEGETGPAL